MSVEKSSTLDLHPRAQQYLKRSELLKEYTPEELKSILNAYEYAYYDIDGHEIPYHDTLLCNARYRARFDEIQEAKQSKGERRKWSYEEDEFLRTNYMYLSDSVIALALNIPLTQVQTRRTTLKLMKEQASNVDVVVWCKRDSFEDDMKKMRLTKARPND